MRVGFEVEVEQSNNTSNNIPGLKITPDGSLRNGVEYVSDVLPDTKYASWLYEYLHEYIEGEYTERCGVHVHLDFSHCSVPDLLDFVFRYLAIERALFRKYPEHLRGNNSFCRPLLDSSNELEVLRRLWQNPEERNTLQAFSKYTALNLRTICTLGTVEFRPLSGGTSPVVFTEVLKTLEQLVNGEETDLQSPVSDILEANVVVDSIKYSTDEYVSNPDEFIHEVFQTSPQTLTTESVRLYLEQ